MDDFISRTAALDAIDGIKAMRGSIEQLVMKGLCWAAVKTIPHTVDVAPVIHGRWIDIPDKPEWDQKMCSVCGDYRCCQGNYCPNCGAKMINEE